ncbi:MAG: class I SAM-dependent methyltransferase [Candidatus Eremiobacteraeota bacterium]|nr:class I SAM-dependent methyltransferase [Candidatus Eremiobacteraeota bacterium]
MKPSLIRTLLRDPVHGLVSIFNQASLTLSRWTRQRYQLAVPFATYAPWLSDPEFMELYQALKKDCLVSLYQCWELWTLGKQKGAEPGDVLEVGVWRGGSSVILGRALGSVDSVARLFCGDSFAGLVKIGACDPHNSEGELSDAGPEEVVARLEQFGVSNFELLCGVFPEETSERIADRRFSLCHIDVDTKQSAEDVFEWVWPRMSNGGVVVFQDYGFHRTPGISELVDGLRGRPGLTVVHNLNGNALVFRHDEAS